jgi:hypothetical protein
VGYSREIATLFFMSLKKLLARGLTISVTKNQTKESSIKQLPCNRERNIQHTTVVPQIHKTIANGSFRWKQKTGADCWTKIADCKPHNFLELSRFIVKKKLFCRFSPRCRVATAKCMRTQPRRKISSRNSLHEYVHTNSPYEYRR